MNPRLLLTTLGVVAAACLAGCAHRQPPLYLWETFPRLQYETLLREGSASPNAQIQALEAHAEKARGENAALPPGLRAHLGMLYLGMGNAQKARELWVAEKVAFPESSPYMDSLLKRLDGPQKPVAPSKPMSSLKTTENPA